MTKTSGLIFALGFVLLLSCSRATEMSKAETEASEFSESSPKEKLKQAYQLFKEGDDEASIQLANEVLELGRATENDTLIGKALTSLCRNSQRKLDTLNLAKLSAELKDLAQKTGDKKWIMYQAHMNAEMWRLIGDMDRAEAYYDQSLDISFETKTMGMYTIEHFNKSFVSIAKGDFETVKALIVRYYQLKEEQGKLDDAYGLIALAYYLEQQKQYKAAFEVCDVSRKLFKEQNLFPEPADEKPLLEVEKQVKENLTEAELAELAFTLKTISVSELLKKYLR